MTRSGPDRRTRKIITERDQGKCRRCYRQGSQIHHRMPRQMGGTQDGKINSPANLVLLCGSCHAYIEAHRDAAYSTGWLVHRWDDPARVGMIDKVSQLIMLGDDGSAVVRRVERRANP